MAVQPLKAVFEWVLRTMMKDQTGIVRTMPKKDLVDFNVAMTAERLMRNGFDPNAFKNANQVENAIKQIEAPRKVQQGIKSTESAKIFDMEGKEISKGSKIMGGKQAETEAEILARINEENKKAVKSLKERKRPDVYTLDDYDTTNMSDIQKEIIKTETKLGNLNPTSPGFRERAKPLIDKIEELKDKMSKIKEDDLPMAQGGRAAFKEGRIARILKSLKPFGSENKFTNQLEGILYGEMGLAEGLNLLSQSGLFAEGGRIGYKDGPDKPGRRTFMKAAAGLASLLPFGIGKVGKVAAPVVAKAAEISGPALAKLVETVMSAGKLISVTGRKVKEMVTKKKLGKVEVEEDIMDGSYIIKKDGKEIYYKPGRMDETGGIEDDIIEVIEDRVKKAGGGIGYMLGE